MSSPFVAEIRIVGFNFAPTGWAFCDGQLLPISQNTALFSLLGTFYGGDGKSTFALPDMQGNVAVGQGQGAGLSDYFLGQQGGSEFVTLIQSEIPFHNHFVQADSQDPGDLQGPAANRSLARSGGGFAFVPGPLNAQFAPETLAPAGGSLPHNNMQPYLTLNYVIAMQGVFPPRG
jgi:microcystin-dependent protein